MYIYFLLLHIAALCGHKKAKMLISGQAETIEKIKSCDLRGAIWFHAASVGEFEQARPLIERIRKQHPQQKIVLTFFSPSGYNLRKDYDKANGVYYLPLATRKNARLLLDALEPKMAIFVKYEFWPNYLWALRKREIKTYLISGIFREKQSFFRWWGAPYRSLLRCFTHLFVQDEASRDLLLRYKIENVSVTGDTRFDRVEEIKGMAKQISVVEAFCSNYSTEHIGPAQNEYKTIVAGSTWPKDDELLCRYVEEHEDVRLVLVPHEITDAHLRYIFQLTHGRQVRYTQATPLNLQTNRVLVVDTIGLLSSIYQYATAAYVGGGFGVGIHNTIEAAVWGKPVLFGPNYKNFREAHGLIEVGAGVSIRNYAEFCGAMDEALANSEEIGRKAREYVTSELGATDKILGALLKE